MSKNYKKVLGWVDNFSLGKVSAYLLVIKVLIFFFYNNAMSEDFSVDLDAFLQEEKFSSSEIEEFLNDLEFKNFISKLEEVEARNSEDSEGVEEEAVSVSIKRKNEEKDSIEKRRKSDSVVEKSMSTVERKQNEYIELDGVKEELPTHLRSINKRTELVAEYNCQGPKGVLC
ncbi:uncharacterized protein LOC127289009 [Leptopilina boulardi]|uniref:uncharacterized protein LOC127289009 n=1 Tax=Leptopilina boulardi TaxID=63433 RepID=UPI0021F54F6E|nr:uncharacterized protein LOC127289009 [Leptopilina boulardi]